MKYLKEEEFSNLVNLFEREISEEEARSILISSVTYSVIVELSENGHKYDPESTATFFITFFPPKSYNFIRKIDPPYPTHPTRYSFSDLSSDEVYNYIRECLYSDMFSSIFAECLKVIDSLQFEGKSLFLPFLCYSISKSCAVTLLMYLVATINSLEGERALRDYQKTKDIKAKELYLGHIHAFSKEFQNLDFMILTSRGMPIVKNSEFVRSPESIARNYEDRDFFSPDEVEQNFPDYATIIYNFDVLYKKDMDEETGTYTLEGIRQWVSPEMLSNWCKLAIRGNISAITRVVALIVTFDLSGLLPEKPRDTSAHTPVIQTVIDGKEFNAYKIENEKQSQDLCWRAKAGKPQSRFCVLGMNMANNYGGYPFYVITSGNRNKKEESFYAIYLPNNLRDRFEDLDQAVRNRGNTRAVSPEEFRLIYPILRQLDSRIEGFKEWYLNDRKWEEEKKEEDRLAAVEGLKRRILGYLTD